MAFIFPDLSSALCVSKFCLRYSYAILFIVPFIIFLYFIIVRANLIRFFDKSEQISYDREKKEQRLVFFIVR